MSTSPALHLEYYLQDIMDKFDLSPYSEHSSAMKMAAYIWGHHLHNENSSDWREGVFFPQNGSLHRGLPFAIIRTIIIGWIISPIRGAFPLLSAVENASDVHPRQTLNANWARNYRIIDPECGPGLFILQHTSKDRSGYRGSASIGPDNADSN